MNLLVEQTDNFLSLWKWLKDADIPNFVIFLFTAIVWPIVLWLWAKRRVRSVTNLEIRLTRHKGKIDEEICEGLRVSFLNKTGSIVYLSNPRLSGCTSRFSVHARSDRNIADSSFELKFLDPVAKIFKTRQQILQTDETAETWIALSARADQKILSYKPSKWRRLLNRQRYFRLDFLAVVADTRYRVLLPY